MNTYTDDTFGLATDKTAAKTNVKGLTFLNDHRSEWVSADISKNFDGFRVTVTSNDNVVKRILLTNDDTFMQPFYGMINLKHFGFNTIFASEYDPEFFDTPLSRSIKTMYLEHVSIASPEFTQGLDVLTCGSGSDEEEEMEIVKEHSMSVERAIIDLFTVVDGEEIHGSEDKTVRYWTEQIPNLEIVQTK